MAWQSLENNPNWKGGRTITEHGYVLIKAPDDPNADCRGYIYEHRRVAETILGRSLHPGEVIHHIDGDKQNNAPSNLMILTHWEHHYHHRRVTCRCRSPWEDNPTITCACGCGQTFEKFDGTGRPRRYVPGHNIVRRR